MGLDISRRDALVAGGWAGFALLGTRHPVAHATPETPLGGIGLTLAEFGARYPAAVDGQGANVYVVDGFNFYVANTSTIDTDRVVSVYWGAGAPAQAAPLPAVMQRLLPFVPEDALLTQVGDAPAAGIGPRLRVDVFNSPQLASVMRGSGFVDSGDLIVAYVYADGLKGTVSWANAYVAVKPG